MILERTVKKKGRKKNTRNLVGTHNRPSHYLWEEQFALGYM